MALDPNAPQGVNPQITDSITQVNTKSLGDGPAFFQNLSFRGAVESANGWSILQQSLVSRAAKYILAEDPNEAVAVGKVMTGNDSAAQMANLGTVVAMIQQAMKGAQTTPPETGK